MDGEDAFPACHFTFKDKKDSTQKIVPLFKGLPTKSTSKIITRSEYIFSPVENAELITQKGKYAEASVRLVAVKEEERLKKRIFAEEWKSLEVKMLEFRKNIKHYHKFCAANQDKRIRATHKIEEEKIICKKYETERLTLAEQIKTLKYIKQKREEDVKLHKIYEIFLDKVIPLSGEFKTIKNIILRYDVLKEVEKETLQSYNRKVVEIKDAFEEMKNVEKHFLLRKMELIGKLMQLQNRHGETRNNTLKWEMTIKQVLEYAAKIRAETLAVLNTTSNIYEMICMRRKQPFDKNLPLEEKFYEIKQSMATSRKVIAAITKKPPPPRKKG